MVAIRGVVQSDPSGDPGDLDQPGQAVTGRRVIPGGWRGCSRWHRASWRARPGPSRGSFLPGDPGSSAARGTPGQRDPGRARCTRRVHTSRVTPEGRCRSAQFPRSASKSVSSYSKAAAAPPRRKSGPRSGRHMQLEQGQADARRGAVREAAGSLLPGFGGRRVASPHAADAGTAGIETGTVVRRERSPIRHASPEASAASWPAGRGSPRHGRRSRRGRRAKSLARSIVS